MDSAIDKVCPCLPHLPPLQHNLTTESHYMFRFSNLENTVKTDKNIFSPS